MTNKFYDNTTEFEEVIILDKNNVIFDEDILIEKKKKEPKEEETKEEETNDEETKDEEKPDTESISDDIVLRSDDIEIIDETSDEVKEFISEITITRVVKSEFIQYTDEQFKNNLLLLCKDISSKDKKLASINNLLNIYKSLKYDKSNKDLDKILYPIIDVKKKFFVEMSLSDITDIDKINYNENEFIIKQSIPDYFNQRNTILESNNPYDVIQNRLYDLDAPFSSLNDSESNSYKYTPTHDRDAITNCINQDKNNFNSDNFRCVNINNEPINLEKFRLLTNKHFKINKEETKILYNGDNVRLTGYVNKIPTNMDNINIFYLEQYFDDIEDMKENDKVNIYLNINNENKKHPGTITSITDNKIKISLNNEIYFNKNTNKLVYEKNNNYNYFNIFPEKEEKNIYYKQPLNNDDSPIICFLFPNEYNDELYNKYLAFILPNIIELISYHDNFINYHDINSLLNKNNFDINSLNNDDINLIQQKINSNIKNLEKTSLEKDLKLKEIKKKTNEFKSDNILLNIDELPEFYPEYLEKNESIDNKQNRLSFLNKQNDNGYYHLINILKTTLEDELKLIKNINFNEELKKFKNEYMKLEIEQKKYKDTDCKQIKIDKFYYNEKTLKNDEGNKKNFENKYVLYTDDSNVYSVLYQMKNGNWTKVTTINASDKESIKLCDGSYYYKKINENICMYDDVEKLCKKRDELVNRRNLEKIELQIEITANLKKFNDEYKEYINMLDTLLEHYKIYKNNEYTINQITYNKDNQNKKYIGDENYIDFDKIYNNFESVNDPFYIPILEEDRTPENVEKKKTEYFQLVEKILNSIGFGLNDTEINHITKSIDFFIQNLLEKEIRKAKDDNSEYKKLTNEQILDKMYNDKTEQRDFIEKNTILIVASMLIIIIQIQYPNVKLIKINNKCSKLFSLLGYPIEKSTEENIKKQLYVYVGCVLSIDYKDDLKMNSKLILKKIQLIIRTILKTRPYYKTLLDKNKKIFEDVSSKDLKIKVWSGYKPELVIKKEPKTTIGRYLFKLFSNINDDKIFKFDIFKKPLINNVCCFDKITSNLNYYDFFKNKLDVNSMLRDINLNKTEKKDLNIIESFYNLLKKETLLANFDSDYIFKEEETLKFKDIVKLIKIEDFDLEYFNYLNNLKNITDKEKNAKLNNDVNLKKLIDNFDNNSDWEKLSSKINELFKSLIEFTKSYSANLDQTLIDDLEIYLVSLRDSEGTLSIENLLNIKKISQQFITYKICALLSKISNKYNINIKKKHLGPNEIDRIKTIIHDENIHKFSEVINSNDTVKINLQHNLNNNKIDVNLINFIDNSNSNKNIDNLTKNVYLLNYLFLYVIYNIYSSLLNLSDDDNEFHMEAILDRLQMLLSSNNIEQNKESQLSVIADIVSYILKEYRDTIKNNLINYDDLQSKMNNLREDRKQKKLLYYDNLSIDDVDALKLLKDIGLEQPLDKDYKEEKNAQNILTDIPEIQEDIMNALNIVEEEDNDIIDYTGENDDELDYGNE